ncbi:MAG: peptide deformylase [Candidatus Sericytochromatia bacterium]
MSILEVKYMGSSVLKREAKKITVINKEIINLAQDMLETMYKYNGVGLAAPQIGVSKRMILVDCGDKYQKEPYVLINPVVVSHKGLQVGDEGCLSLPGMYLPVVRAEYVAVEAIDLSGNKIVVEGKELLSRCLQHEIDHLNGQLFCEIVNDKNKLDEELPKLKARIDAILRGEISPFPTEQELEEEEGEIIVEELESKV